ncbi:hypothetical protein E8E11_000597 [Didymella keratinophila]|nr:hypothetical protein E8E11_000597 [Didymella keratinophila]
MKLFIISFVALTGLTAASPVTLNARADRNSYTMSGLGSRKQQVFNAGASSLDLAIAMLETDNMIYQLYVASRWDCQNYYGYDRWFAEHRSGASGLATPNTVNINTYKSAIQWVQQQIDSNTKYRSDDTRFW